MTLYDIHGNEVTESLEAFGPMPVSAVALKYADDEETGRWITDIAELAQLWREDAPLVYTLAGAMALRDECGIHITGIVGVHADPKPLW